MVCKNLSKPPWTEIDGFSILDINTLKAMYIYQFECFYIRVINLQIIFDRLELDLWYVNSSETQHSHSDILDSVF